MGTNNQHFKDPLTAREYIKSLAICFDDPNDLSEFLGMCDIVQAIFVNILIEEICYECIIQSDNLMSDNYKNEIHSKITKTINNCEQAAAELEHVKQKLKLLISKLAIVSI